MARSPEAKVPPSGSREWCQCDLRAGATETTAMTRIATQERLGGKAVEWLELVTDEQYQREN
jgi:hypothetical protein